MGKFRMGLGLRIEELGEKFEPSFSPHFHEQSSIPSFNFKRSLQLRNIMHDTPINLKTQPIKLPELDFNSQFGGVLEGR